MRRRREIFAVGRESESGLVVGGVRTAGAGCRASSGERLVHDLLDGAGATAALGAAAEAAIDLAGRARLAGRGRACGTHVVVSEDVAGTHNHEVREPRQFSVATLRP